MKQALWKAIWQFLIKLNIYSPYDPAILLGGLCLGKIKIYVQKKNTNTYGSLEEKVFTATQSLRKWQDFQRWK